MNPPNYMANPLSDGSQSPRAINLVQSHARSLFPRSGAAALVLLAGILAAPAAFVTLTASDAGGTTSYNPAGHWSNAAAPAPGNAYSVGNGITLRTPAPTTSGNNYIFLGESLSLNSGARLLGKVGNNVGGSTVSATITGTNLILAGGMLD